MALREVGRRVWAVSGGVFPSNSYICATGEGSAVLVDVGLDARPIDDALGSLGLRPSQVFCTHGHFDHLGEAAVFQDRYGIPVYLHRGDDKTARTNNFLLMAMKLPARVRLPEITLVDGDYQHEVGAHVVRYRHTPGHTPGSCVLAVGGNLFTGDTLYARGVGLSKLPGEKPEQLRESIRSVWDDLDRFMIHPGHGPSIQGSLLKKGNVPLLSFLGILPNQNGQAAHG